MNLIHFIDSLLSKQVIFLAVMLMEIRYLLLFYNICNEPELLEILVKFPYPTSTSSQEGSRNGLRGLAMGVQSLTVGPELSQAVARTANKSLEYAAVRGKVAEFHKPAFPPSVNGVSSLVRHIKHKEIVSKYAWNMSMYTMNGKYYETKEFTPFCLQPLHEISMSFNFAQQCDKEGVIFTTDLTTPTLLIKDITQTHTGDLLKNFPTYYENVERSSSFNLWNYIFGLQTIVGIQKTEALLPVGDVITVLGKVVQTGQNEYTLTAPTAPNAIYMLTSTPFEEILEEHSVKSIEGHLLLMFMGAATVFVLWDLIKRLRKLYDLNFKDIGDANDNDNMIRSDQEEGEGGPEDQQLCIICQEQPRNVVLLDCRHFCVCNACAIKLKDEHQKCPVCRRKLHGVMKVFVS